MVEARERFLEGGRVSVEVDAMAEVEGSEVVSVG